MRYRPVEDVLGRGIVDSLMSWRVVTHIETPGCDGSVTSKCLQGIICNALNKALDPSSVTCPQCGEPITHEEGDTYTLCSNGHKSCSAGNF